MNDFLEKLRQAIGYYGKKLELVSSQEPTLPIMAVVGSYFFSEFFMHEYLSNIYSQNI